jgi:hypothetical protein
VAQQARQNTDTRARKIAMACAQKQNPGVGFRPVSGSGFTPGKPKVPGSVSGPTSSGSVSTPTSISREETSVCQPREPTDEHQPLDSQPDGSTPPGEQGERAADDMSPSRSAPVGGETADNPASPSGCHFPSSLTTVEPSTVRRATPGPADPSASPYRMPPEPAMNRDVCSAAQGSYPTPDVARPAPAAGDDMSRDPPAPKETHLFAGRPLPYRRRIERKEQPIVG